VAWITYDLANTIFALGIVGLYFPQWLTELDTPDIHLSIVISTAGVVVIFLAPWIGARSDHLRRRMPGLVMTTLVAVSATSLLGVQPMPFTFVAFGIALVAVNTGSVLYDALLAFVSTPENQGKISGIGVGVGYVGSFIGLGIGYAALELMGFGYPTTFRLLALGFLVFSLPAFLFVREPSIPPLPGDPPGLRSVVSELKRGWARATEYPDVLWFLVGRFLYTDAINTLIGGYLTIFAIEELGLDTSGSQALLAIAIATAIVGGISGGYVVERLGPRRVLRAMLLIWIGALIAGVAAAVTGVTSLVWLIGAAGGFALGGTWASDRVVMIRVSPPRHLGEFYGLYATVGRFATVVGPLVWGLIVSVLGLGRVTALGALGLFIAAGWWLLRRVDDTARTWAPELQ
jgi:UMF1 family MFS transporter